MTAVEWMAANSGTIISGVFVLVGVLVTGWLTHRATRRRDTGQLALDMAEKNEGRVDKLEKKLAGIVTWWEEEHRPYDDMVWRELLKHDPTAADRIPRPKSMPIY